MPYTPPSDFGIVTGLELRERRLSRLQRQKEIEEELARRKAEDTARREAEQARQREASERTALDRRRVDLGEKEASERTALDRRRADLDEKKFSLDEGDTLSRRNRLKSYLAGEEALDATENPRLVGAEGPEMSPERVQAEIVPKRDRNFQRWYPEEAAAIRRQEALQDRYDKRQEALQDRYDKRESERGERVEGAAKAKAASTLTRFERDKLDALKTQINTAYEELLEIEFKPGWQKNKSATEKHSAVKAKIKALEDERAAMESDSKSRTGGDEAPAGGFIIKPLGKR